MTLREFCKNNVEVKFLKIAFLILALSILFSLSIYLKKVKLNLEGNISKIELVGQKINQSYEIKKQVEKISFPERKNPELAVAHFLDNLKSKYPEIKFELSEQKKENRELVFSYNLKGDGTFERYLGVVNLLYQENYPVVFIHATSIRKKENILNYEIKGDIRLISDE